MDFSGSDKFYLLNLNNNKESHSKRETNYFQEINMKSIIILSSLLLTTASFANDTKIEDFAGTYSIISCNLGGFLKRAYYKTYPELKNVGKNAKTLTIVLENNTNDKEMSINLLLNDGQSTNFGSQVMSDDFENLNKGKIRWEDSSWGTKYFSETSLKGSTFCHASSGQDDFCMKLNDDSSLDIKFTPNIGLSLTCKAKK